MGNVQWRTIRLPESRVEDFKNLVPFTAGYRRYQGAGSAIPTTSAGIPAGMQWPKGWRTSNPRQGSPEKWCFNGII